MDHHKSLPCNSLDFCFVNLYRRFSCNIIIVVLQVADYWVVGRPEADWIAIYFSWWLIQNELFDATFLYLSHKVWLEDKLCFVVADLFSFKHFFHQTVVERSLRFLVKELKQKLQLIVSLVVIHNASPIVKGLLQELLFSQLIREHLL